MDAEELFESTFHRFFDKIETPHSFLLEEDRTLEPNRWMLDLQRQRLSILDFVTMLHLSVRYPIKEPDRLKKALGHLEGTVAQGKLMWKHILAETDDDNEWIPSPKQTGVLQVKVTREMVDNWLTTLNEVELILQGKKLVPFWRGEKKDRGLNVRKMFTEPAKVFDLVKWVQGTAATPYLERGTITSLADPKTITRLDRVFGGFNFFSYAAWFN